VSTGLRLGLWKAWAGALLTTLLDFLFALFRRGGSSLVSSPAGLTHFLCLAKESKQRKARPRWRKTP
ncbi:hypothetical protein, partial [Ralstonia pickettii]|uniref:hypothetical protein n=1 Tax=Ralstonia pickettii TaxID=329 RepID=UPI001BB0A260